MYGHNSTSTPASGFPPTSTTTSHCTAYAHAPAPASTPPKTKLTIHLITSNQKVYDRNRSMAVPQTLRPL